MRKVFVAGDNLITSLGFTTEENIAGLSSNRIGLQSIDDRTLSPGPLPLSVINSTILNEKFFSIHEKRKTKSSVRQFTRLEKLFILSVSDAIQGMEPEFFGDKTVLIISTTKGNIDLLEEKNQSLYDEKRVFLWRMAEVIMDYFGFHNTPVIISNACISGVLAIGTAFRYLSSGMYETACVIGGDILTEFVISGFQSFQALSPESCKPYDLHRKGLSLGEGCGTLILTTNSSKIGNQMIVVEGMSTTNDANHISGPSRTGEELAMAIKHALKEARIQPADLGYISAHGTATPFNDEMESKAFVISGIQDVPVNSFKGYWGHTLGAAGVIESIAAIHSIKKDLIFKSAGFTEPGVTEKINVVAQNLNIRVDHLLKTASGFGGCNAAVIFGKD